jgi:hypothetical protein
MRIDLGLLCHWHVVSHSSCINTPSEWDNDVEEDEDEKAMLVGTYRRIECKTERHR